MSKNQLKSLVERLKQASEGSLHLGTEARIKRSDLELAIASLEIQLQPTHTIQVTNGRDSD